LTEEEINTTYLVPELCYLHPIPSTVWKQIVWIPSILHRLTGLLLAEELRVQIHREAKIGVEFLPYSVNVSSVWSPLLLQTEQPNGSILPVADPRLLPTSFRPRMSPKNVDLLSADAELVWNVELLDSFSLSDSTDDDPLNLTMNSPDSSTIAVPDDETLNLRFDISSLSSVFGPSPGEILEALTLTGSSDGYDMERLETLGDSLLKLTISIYAFGLTYKENMNEGQLSLMRAQQISNENLFRLGHQKNLGNLMAGQSFDVANSFLPPCFRPNGTLHNGPIDQRLQQVVSSKHIADSVEV
jgi:endoribonuclease Dicer